MQLTPKVPCCAGFDSYSDTGSTVGVLVVDSRSWVVGRGSWVVVRGSWVVGRGSWFVVAEFQVHSLARILSRTQPSGFVFCVTAHPSAATTKQLIFRLVENPPQKTEKFKPLQHLSASGNKASERRHL
jgi:hypothetical protein